MTPQQVREARHKLGLSLEQLATLLGYLGTQRRQMMWDIENNRRPLREPQERLLLAYLDGYRPDDWPEQGTSSAKGLDL